MQQPQSSCVSQRIHTELFFVVLALSANCGRGLLLAQQEQGVGVNRYDALTVLAAPANGQLSQTYGYPRGMFALGDVSQSTTHAQ